VFSAIDDAASDDIERDPATYRRIQSNSESSLAKEIVRSFDAGEFFTKGAARNLLGSSFKVRAFNKALDWAAEVRDDINISGCRRIYL
jgi:hypothetical protein